MSYDIIKKHNPYFMSYWQKNNFASKSNNLFHPIFRVESTSPTSVQVAGSAVEDWFDISGFGTKNDASQSSESFAPIYNLNVLNSENIVRFDGVDDFLDFVSSAWFQNLKSRTVLIVSRQNGEQPSPDSLIFGDGYYNHANTYAQKIDGSYRIEFSNPPATPVQLESTTISEYGFPILLSSTFNSQSDGGSGLATLYINNVLEDSGTVAFDPGAHANDKVAIGRYLATDNSARTFNGDIAEIIVYNKVLPKTQLDYISNYLMSKYSILDKPIQTNLLAWMEAFNCDIGISPVSTFKNLTGNPSPDNFTAGQQPLLGTASLNSMPALEFDGINDNLVVIDSSLAYSTEYSFFVLAEEIADSSNIEGIAGTRNLTSTPKGGFNFYRANVNKHLESWHLASDGVGWVIADTEQIRSPGTPFIMGDVAVIGQSNGRLTFVDDNNTIGTIPAGSLPNAVGSLTIGAEDPSVTYPGNFKISCVLYYNRALTSTEIEYNKAYIRKRFNLN